MKCVIRGCSRPAKRRGLCLPCYQAAGRLVREGRKSWAALEKRGLAKPLVDGKGGKTPFTRAVGRARAD